MPNESSTLQKIIQRQRLILDSIPAMVAFWDKEQKCQYANKAYLDWFNYDPEKLIGKTMLELFGPELYAKNVSYIQGALNGHEQKFERVLIKKSTGMPMLTSANYLPEVIDNEVQGFFVLVFDITEVKKHEKLLEKAQALANVGSFEMDLKTQKIEWSKQMFTIFGFPASDTAPSLKDIEEKMTPEFPEEWLQKRQKCRTEGVPYAARLKIKNEPEERWIEARGEAIYQDDQIVGVRGTCQDITEQILANRKLDEALQLAQQSSQAKAQFLANMSHEIRTPLNGVIGMTNLLKDTDPTAIQMEYIEHINQSGAMLLALINDTLDLSKIESGKIEFEELNFNLEHTINSVMNSLAYTAKNKNIELRTEFAQTVPHYLKGDASRIKQVLINLLSNAIKFTLDGSVIVRTILHNVTSSHLKFRVELQDTGIGISEENQKKLFQSFTQVSASTHRKYGGTGLGLSISKRLIERMGGQIGLTSTEGKGSTFWFDLELPLGHAELNVVEIDSAATNQTRKQKRILIAEDNIVNQKVAQAILKKLGYDSMVVASGSEVISALEHFSFDLILMDCQMPEVDGFAATQLIRKNVALKIKNIPVIAMTANAMPGDHERCLASGMNDYVSKPISASDLEKVIEKWI
jgi:PAS domain S-box-containing protein